MTPIRNHKFDFIDIKNHDIDSGSGSHGVTMTRDNQDIIDKFCITLSDSHWSFVPLLRGGKYLLDIKVKERVTLHGSDHRGSLHDVVADQVSFS